MRDRQNRHQKKVRQSLFPPSLFAAYLGALFLISGIHTGLVAVGLTLFTRKKMKP